MFEKNRICQLFGVQYPIVQGGMIWNSGWKLASAVSNAGGLGLIGAGSMHPQNLEHHIVSCQAATDKPFGVNVPLLYPEIDKIIDIILNHQVKIVFTSAGNPALWTPKLKSAGITVVHVVANLKFAKKAYESGVDAIVGEGFEAGGHNGIDEITTFCLIPQLKKQVSIPIIAAGGIATGNGMAAAFALGAEGVQVGTRFAASLEASSHPAFKQKIVEANDTATKLVLKKVTPVRLLKNKFYEAVESLEQQGADKAALQTLLGKGRAKKGMFEGDLDDGELEIGQIAGLIESILPASQIVHQFITEFQNTVQSLSNA